MTRSAHAASDLRENLGARAAVEAARVALCSHLDLADCAFEPWPFAALLPRIERGRIVLPADVVGARSYRDWKPADGIELPVRADGLPLGRFVLVTRTPTTGIAFAVPDRERALHIADQCAHALVVGLTEGVVPWKT